MSKLVATIQDMRDTRGRFKKGNNRPEEWTLAQTKKVSDAKNYAWKGEQVSYRGLHQWVRRKKGLPTKCTNCGKESEKPRIIQWANVDRMYRRNLEDFIALCCSCHKFHDLKLKSTQDEQFANQSNF